MYLNLKENLGNMCHFFLLSINVWNQRMTEEPVSLPSLLNRKCSGKCCYLNVCHRSNQLSSSETSQRISWKAEQEGLSQNRLWSTYLGNYCRNCTLTCVNSNRLQSFIISSDLLHILMRWNVKRLLGSIWHNFLLFCCFFGFIFVCLRCICVFLLDLSWTFCCSSSRLIKYLLFSYFLYHLYAGYLQLYACNKTCF